MTEETAYKVKRGVKIGIVIFISAVIGIILGHIVSTYELRFLLSREYCGTFRGIDIYKSGDIDTDNFAKHAQMLDMAPDALVECCDRMYFTGTDLGIPATDAGYSSALGLTQGKTIFISTLSFGEDVVFHELFHAYDNTHDLPSEHSQVFLDAFNEEAGKISFVVGDEAALRSEYYATAGAIYIVMPDKMKILIPKTYAYFDNLLRLYD